MAGFLSFLGFGKKKKNETPEVKQAPGVESAPMYGNLRDFAQGGFKASQGAEVPGVGFGENFLDKTTNPAIAQIDANFKNRTLPTLSSQQSKRGIARSSIATDQIAQADLQRGRDISSMVAEMYKLNEMQKKSDVSERVRVGQDINNDFLDIGKFNAGQFNQMGEANANRQAQFNMQENADSNKRQNAVIGSMMNAVAPGSGMAFNSQPYQVPAMTPQTKQNLLGDSDFQALESVLKQMGLI